MLFDTIYNIKVDIFTVDHTIDLFGQVCIRTSYKG